MLVVEKKIRVAGDESATWTYCHPFSYALTLEGALKKALRWLGKKVPGYDKSVRIHDSKSDLGASL